jgi:uncharacterized protein
MDWSSWTLVGVGLLGAGIVKGATGIGYATCALPMLTAVVGLKSAMVLVLAPTFATNVSLAFGSNETKPLIWKYSALYAAMVPGIGVGVWLLSSVDPRSATSILGLLLVSYAIFSLSKPKLALSESAERHLKIPVGFLNGVLTGLTGSQVIPLVPYMMSTRLETSQAIQAINIGVLVLTTLLGGGLLAAQLVDPILFQLSVLAAAPALAGVSLGAALRSRLPQPFIRTIVVTTVGLIGLKMLLD